MTDKTKLLLCPFCGNELNKVIQPENSMLNSYQFDAVKAGDFYCINCPSNGRGNTPYRYFWLKELKGEPTMTDDITEARQKWLRECDAQTIAGAFKAGAQWQSQQSQGESVQGESVPDEVFSDEFKKWWEDQGCLVRSGGGRYERFFAFEAFRYLMPEVLAYRAAPPAPAAVPEAESLAEIVSRFLNTMWTANTKEERKGLFLDAQKALKAYRESTAPQPAETEEKSRG